MVRWRDVEESAQLLLLQRRLEARYQAWAQSGLLVPGAENSYLRGQDICHGDKGRPPKAT